MEGVITAAFDPLAGESRFFTAPSTQLGFRGKDRSAPLARMSTEAPDLLFNAMLNDVNRSGGEAGEGLFRMPDLAWMHTGGRADVPPHRAPLRCCTLAARHFARR